jgi:cysteine desulfurase
MDYQATTPLDPRVLAVMMPYFTEQFGNAASRSHAFGWAAEEAVLVAREQVAEAIGAAPEEIVWTSGATESINLALKGAIGATPGGLVTLATEHAATLDTCRWLSDRGSKVDVLAVDELGRVDLHVLEVALSRGATLISVLHGNNEIGTVQEIAAIGQLAKRFGVLFHVDAAQTFGRLPIDVGAMGIDLLSLSGHKIYGPKGVGALYVRRRGPRVRLAAQLHGGGHERGMRSGTLNVPGVAGLGEAARLAGLEMVAESARTIGLRDRLIARLTGELSGVSVNGDRALRLAGNVSATFELAEASAIIAKIPGIALSSGAACSSASLAPSHVLAAIGLSEHSARCTLRFGLGRFTTPEEVEIVADRVIEAVNAVRQTSPVFELWQAGLDVSTITGSGTED